jgi:hypothetical protein
MNRRSGGVVQASGLALIIGVLIPGVVLAIERQEVARGSELQDGATDEGGRTGLRKRPTGEGIFHHLAAVSPVRAPAPLLSEDPCRRETARLGPRGQEAWRGRWGRFSPDAHSIRRAEKRLSGPSPGPIVTAAGDSAGCNATETWRERAWRARWGWTSKPRVRSPAVPIVAGGPHLQAPGDQ